MAEVIGVVAAIAGLLQLATPTIDLVSRTAFQLRDYDRNTISQSYGPLAGFLISTFYRSTASEYERLERVVLRGSDEEALGFQASVTSECNMTAVAGAIIAQVALTALSLADLSLAHWTVRAFLLFATVAGCLSVYYACSLSRDIGKLFQPELIREWLSAKYAPLQTRQEGEKERKASISAIFILSAPYIMMTYAILAFITGLAIYQGFVWTRNLDTDAGKINSRNVFIAYIVSSGFGITFFSFAGVIKYVEGLLMLRHSYKTIANTRARNQETIGGVVGPLNSYDDPSAELPEYPSAARAEIATNSSSSVHATSQTQDTGNENPSTGIAAALEAAAKAHILSAEADRQVAMEYAKLSTT